MKFIMKIFLSFTVYSIPIHSISNKAMSNIQDFKFLNALKPYQMTIFRDCSIGKNNKEDFIFQKITNRISVVTIDLHKMNNSNNNRSLSMPVMKNPRKSSIHIIFEQENNHNSELNKTYDIIDKIVEISPIPMRPKCLVILCNKNMTFENNIIKLLHHAWMKKFLDFTILNLNSSRASYLIYYNPFTKIHKT